jgi:hypothetical protein
VSLTGTIHANQSNVKRWSARTVLMAHIPVSTRADSCRSRTFLEKIATEVGAAEGENSYLPEPLRYG